MAKEENGVHIPSIDINAPRINQIAPTQVALVDEAEAAAAAPVSQNPKNPTFTSTIFKILFFAHLLIVAILISFLSIRGFLSKNPRFHPLHYFLPLLSSITLSALVSFSWLLFTLHYPAKTLDSSLWLSPLLTCLSGTLLLIYGTSISFAFGAPAVVFGISQSMYACWVSHRMEYARQILSVSMLTVRFRGDVGNCLVVALLVAVGYSWVWILGVGAIAAADDRRFDVVYVLLLLLSLAWTMQVIRNLVHVSVSHIAHTYLTQGSSIPAHTTFHDANTRSLGEICIGSLTSPIITLIRGTARALDTLAGDTEEFLFSCSSCYLGTADRLIVHANRWGFVHVGARGEGFGEASEGTWEMFRSRGMCRLIDVDVTSSFCFFCGCAGGALAALVCGSWMLAVDEGYATGPTVYAFIIGYFMVRIGMAWPQACVSAYYVAYAEDPENGLLGRTIANRIRELNAS